MPAARMCPPARMEIIDRALLADFEAEIDLPACLSERRNIWTPNASTPEYQCLHGARPKVRPLPEAPRAPTTASPTISVTRLQTGAAQGGDIQPLLATKMFLTTS